MIVDVRESAGRAYGGIGCLMGDDLSGYSNSRRLVPNPPSRSLEMVCQVW